MAVNRRPLLLGFTLVVAIIAAIAVRSTEDQPSGVVGAVRPTVLPGQAQPAGRPNPAANPGQTPDVNLQALTRERGEPLDGRRNPFRFQPKPPPPPPPSSMRPPNETSVAPVPVVPTGPPPPPPIPLKFIGIVQKADGTRIAVLSDGRKPMSGTEGQEIAGQYRILKIGNESIEMQYIDGRGRQTIRLTGQ